MGKHCGVSTIHLPSIILSLLVSMKNNLRDPWRYLDKKYLIEIFNIKMVPTRMVCHKLGF